MVSYDRKSGFQSVGITVSTTPDSGCNPSRYIHFEKGVSIPAQETIKLICEVYGVDPGYFKGEQAVEEAVVKNNIGVGIGERLRSAREEKGWSQNELAKRSGVSQPVISQVESGTKLTEKQGRKIAETLEIGYDWLMTGNEKKKMYPADQKMMDWLWEKEDVRREIWERMNAV
jgi:transcriptional regulator with XRE-family HTH domain